MSSDILQTYVIPIALRILLAIGVYLFMAAEFDRSPIRKLFK